MRSAPVVQNWHFFGRGGLFFRTHIRYPGWASASVLASMAFLACPALAEDFYWRADEIYNEGSWVGSDYLLSFPDEICGHDAEGRPLYEMANDWRRTCCGCSRLPYPHVPSDRAFLGSRYSIHLYGDCGHPDCSVSIASLNMGWHGYLRMDADLTVSAPMLVPPGSMLDINGGCHLAATIINRGEMDSYLPLDNVVALNGSLKNEGRLYIGGVWANSGGAGKLDNSGGGFIDSEAFSTDLAITNAGYLWIMANSVILQGAFTQTAGTLLVNGPSYYTTLENAQPLDIRGGQICGLGPISGHVINSGGILAPGFPEGFWFSPSVGQLVAGGYTQGSGGTLQIRLVQGDWDELYALQQADQVKVTGTACLAGALHIIHAARQIAGERYVVVSAANIVGQFESVAGPGHYGLTYEPTRVILTVLDPGVDEMAPGVAIESPTLYSEYTTASAAVDLAGTAWDDIGVGLVTWSTGARSGTCTGNEQWSATGIPLETGRTVITITARDVAGNPACARIVVTQDTLPWDLDRDGDVDRDDLEQFQACMHGPAIVMAATCAGQDLDNDGDVDQQDFGILQRCLRGVNKPIDPHCAD